LYVFFKKAAQFFWEAAQTLKFFYTFRLFFALYAFQLFLHHRLTAANPHLKLLMPPTPSLVNSRLVDSCWRLPLFLTLCQTLMAALFAK
jgi:hypothetical protein